MLGPALGKISKLRLAHVEAGGAGHALAALLVERVRFDPRAAMGGEHVLRAPSQERAMDVQSCVDLLQLGVSRAPSRFLGAVALPRPDFVSGIEQRVDDLRTDG